MRRARMASLTPELVARVYRVVEDPGPDPEITYLNEEDYDGRCQVGGRRTNLPPLLPISRSRSDGTRDAGDIAPSLKGTITGGSVLCGS